MKIKIIILIVFIIYSSYYVFSIFNYKIDSEVRTLCNNIYLCGDNVKYTIIKSLLSKEECSNLIKEGEDYGEKYGWQKKRHDHYSTL